HLHSAHLSSLFFLSSSPAPPAPHSFPTRRSSDLLHTSLPVEPPAHEPPLPWSLSMYLLMAAIFVVGYLCITLEHPLKLDKAASRSEEHTSELQSRENLVCRLLLEKKKKQLMNKR